MPVKTLRKQAAAGGCLLRRSRSRDPGAAEYGLYAVIDRSTNAPVNPPLPNGSPFSWTRDEARDFLAKAAGSGPADRQKR